MTKIEQDILIRLVESLNQGNCLDEDKRVAKALKQLEQLKAIGCKFEDKPAPKYDGHSSSQRSAVYGNGVTR